MKNLLILLPLVLMLGFVFGNNPAKKPKTETVNIKTSAQCGHCVEAISKALTYTKGVVDFTVDADTKVATVTYKTKKTSVDAIRTAINEAGYDADEMPANAEAYSKLSACCKKGGKACDDKHN